MSVFDLNLETDRLRLRPTRIEDFEGFAELFDDEEAARHIGGHMPRAAAWRRFLQQPGAWMLQGFGMFSVLNKRTGQWLGQTGPWRPEGWPGNEIGWAFRRSAWGHGYAREATIAAIDWAFATLGWESIIHCIAAENMASKHLAARLGSTMLRRAMLPPPFDGHECEVWGQAASDWARSRKACSGH